MEISQLISSADQLTSFYRMATLAFNELIFFLLFMLLIHFVPMLPFISMLSSILLQMLENTGA